MKKILILAAMMLTCASGFSQTVTDIFSYFKGKEGVQIMELPHSMLQMALSQADDADSKELLKNIESINILQIEDKKLAKEFSTKTTDLEKQGYTRLLTQSEENERTLILSRTENDTITELVILNIEPNEAALVQVLGKIRSEDVEKLVHM